MKLTGSPGKQILLIHANLLNSLCLGDIINMYEEKGYKFISLEEALGNNHASATNNQLPAVQESKTEESVSTKPTPSQKTPETPASLHLI